MLEWPARYFPASNVKIIRSIPAATRFGRAAARPLVLVPTMGALHEGHAALIRHAKRRAGAKGTTVVSIFVNPAQFGPQEDLARYPRPFAADCALCRELGTDAIFHPKAAGMYREDHSVWVNEDLLSTRLCGAARPGHFRGVCTVVLKLFHLLQPDAAVFGLKDFQQLMIIRQMMRDLNLPVRILPVETIRERDGLALSSRNVYLSSEERAQAPVLRQALLAARAAFRRGVVDAEKLRRLLVQTIAAAPLAKIDYVEIAEAATLVPVSEVKPGCVLALAVFFGRTRLIDNLWLK